MPYADDLDPTSSVQSFYATDLRRHRERLGITQRDMAKYANISPSLLNKVEACKRLPTKELSEKADERFETDDHFRRLWPLVIRYAYPPGFRPYLELEVAASIIRSFEAQLIPGLLQTESYARALMSGSRLPTDIVQERVAARMERQALLTRQPPPELWFVLDENVFQRHQGGREVMRAQLERLIATAQQPHIVIQVVPYSAGGHAGVGGPFSVLAMDEGPDVVWSESFIQGQLLADPAQVKEALRAYDLLTAVALSPEASVNLIAAKLKELAP